MKDGESWVSHLTVALVAAALFALCQVTVETLAIAAQTRSFVLSPRVFFGGQMYDYCIKLFVLLPGTGDWFQGSALDRFLLPGLAGKLPVGSALIVPNLVVLAAAGILIGSCRRALRRPPSAAAVVGWIVALGFLVHLSSWGFAVHVPKAWSAWVIVRNVGRVFVWEGTYLAFAVLFVAGGAAAWIVRLRPPLRAAVSVGLVSAAALLLLAAQPLAGSSDASLPPAPPLPSAAGGTRVDNVILISIDSLRADHLGSYGNERDTSPTMDRLAREGVRFSNVMSTTSWTLPSHQSLLTGRSVLAHGVITEKDGLPAEIPTLAEQLQQAGLRTGGVVSIPLLGKPYGFARGFDHYDDETIPSPTQFDALSDEPAPVVTTLALDWIREHRDRRFFLFLHYWDVHYDYIPPPPYDTMFDPGYDGPFNGVNFYKDGRVNRHMPKRDLEHIIALYDGEIRWVDDHLSRIVAALDDLGLAGRTAIIVTADHGDEFFEHGYKGHGRTLYREVVQIPLIMRAPGVEAGQVIDEPVSLVDVAPTILELAGAAAPPGLNGVSLVPTFTGRRLSNRAGVYAWLCNLKVRTNCMAMQHDDTGTLIHVFQPLRVEFYGADDRAQAHNLAGSGDWPRQAQMATMGRTLDELWREYRGTGAEQGTLELDKATVERLRALGYID